MSCSVVHVWFFCDPMDCSTPGSSVPGILQAGIPEWIAIPFSLGIFPTQWLNPGLLHCRWIFYCLSHQGSPIYVHTHSYMPVPITRYLSRSTSAPRAIPLFTVCGCVYLYFCTRIHLPWRQMPCFLVALIPLSRTVPGVWWIPNKCLSNGWANLPLVRIWILDFTSSVDHLLDFSVTLFSHFSIKDGVVSLKDLVWEWD